VLVVWHYFHDVACQKSQPCLCICQSYVQVTVGLIFPDTVYKYKYKYKYVCMCVFYTCDRASRIYMYLTNLDSRAMLALKATALTSPKPFAIDLASITNYKSSKTRFTACI